MHRFGLFASSILSLPLLACGGTVQVGAGGAGAGTSTSGTSVSTSTGPGSTASGGVMSPCPAALPTGACAIEGLACSYGTDPRHECRDASECTQGQWVVHHAACSPPSGGDVCGGAPPAAGSVCAIDGDFCAYGDGTMCGCSACSGGGPCMAPPPHWQCSTPATGCPSALPNEGTTCAPEGRDCVYGQPCGVSGVETKCVQGLWVWLPGQACPV